MLRDVSQLSVWFPLCIRYSLLRKKWLFHPVSGPSYYAATVALQNTSQISTLRSFTANLMAHDILYVLAGPSPEDQAV